MNRAIADGSFDKVFMSSPSVQEAISKGDMKNRILIPLKNPLITEQVPVDREELWIDPATL